MTARRPWKEVVRKGCKGGCKKAHGMVARKRKPFGKLGIGGELKPKYRAMKLMNCLPVLVGRTNRMPKRELIGEC